MPSSACQKTLRSRRPAGGAGRGHRRRAGTPRPHRPQPRPHRPHAGPRGDGSVDLVGAAAQAACVDELVREAHQLVKAARVNFIGNVEPRDVYSGEADVIVCDGFAGNVALKTSEGLVELVEGLLSDFFLSTIATTVGSLFTRRALLHF